MKNKLYTFLATSNRTWRWNSENTRSCFIIFNERIELSELVKMFPGTYQVHQKKDWTMLTVITHVEKQHFAELHMPDNEKTVINGHLRWDTFSENLPDETKLMAAIHSDYEIRMSDIRANDGWGFIEKALKIDADKGKKIQGYKYVRPSLVLGDIGSSFRQAIAYAEICDKILGGELKVDFGNSEKPRPKSIPTSGIDLIAQRAWNELGTSPEWAKHNNGTNKAALTRYWKTVESPCETCAHKGHCARPWRCHTGWDKTYPHQRITPEDMTRLIDRARANYGTNWSHHVKLLGAIVKIGKRKRGNVAFIRTDMTGRAYDEVMVQGSNGYIHAIPIKDLEVIEYAELSIDEDFERLAMGFSLGVASAPSRYEPSNYGSKEWNADKTNGYRSEMNPGYKMQQRNYLTAAYHNRIVRYCDWSGSHVRCPGIQCDNYMTIIAELNHRERCDFAELFSELDA